MGDSSNAFSTLGRLAGKKLKEASGRVRSTSDLRPNDKTMKRGKSSLLSGGGSASPDFPAGETTPNSNREDSGIVIRSSIREKGINAMLNTS
jgi:hypothetical protein